MIAWIASNDSGAGVAALAAVSLPAALWGLALALPILALYIWFRRTQRVQVSFLVLWERVAEQAHRSWWRIIRWVISVLIALGLLTALVVSAADPGAELPATPSATTQRLIVLVDTSPSCLAPDWAAPDHAAWVTDTLREMAGKLRPAAHDTLDVIWQDATGWHSRALAAGEPIPADFATTIRPEYRPIAWGELVTLAAEAEQRRAREALGVVDAVEVRRIVLTDGQPPPAPWNLDRAATDSVRWKWPGSGDETGDDGGDNGGDESGTGTGAPAAQTPVAEFLAWQPAAKRIDLVGRDPREITARWAGNVGLIGAEVWPAFPATPSELRLTVVAHPPANEPAESLSVAIRGEIVGAVERTEAIGELARIELAPNEPKAVAIQLPSAPPSDLPRHVAGPGTWKLMLRLDVKPDARAADDALELVLPVVEPTPVIVGGTALAGNPLIVPLFRLLERRGICRVIRSTDDEARSLADPPVLVVVGDWSGEMPPHRARIEFRGPSALEPGIAPGNLLEWSPTAPIPVADFTDTPLSVRRARVLVPTSARTVPILAASGSPVADFTPAEGGGAGAVPIVRVGFSLDPAATDLLVQPTLAPLLFKRMLALVRPATRPPLPLFVRIGEPAMVDLDVGSAVARLAQAEPQAMWAMEMPSPLRGSMPDVKQFRPLDLPPVRLRGAMAKWPGTIYLRMQPPEHARGSAVNWQSRVVLLDADESRVAVPGPSVPDLSAWFVPIPEPEPSEPWNAALVWLALGLLLTESVLYRFRLSE